MTNNRNERKLSEKVTKQFNHHDEPRTPLDKYEDQQFVDDIPLRDLEIESEQEKNKHKTQNTSQSEEKYKKDMDEK